MDERNREVAVGGWRERKGKKREQREKKRERRSERENKD